MRFSIPIPYALTVFYVATLLLLAGCGKTGNTEGPDSASDAAHNGTTAASGDHEGWWCAEHGVPEEICTRCDSSLIAGFKEKGDWCDEHDCPDSQCFVCHPELEAKFADRYEAKFGKKPPNPTEL